MNAPLRVPTSTRTPLIARSFHVVSRSGRVLPPPRSRGEEYQLPENAEPRLRAPRAIPSSVSLAATQQAEQLYGVGPGEYVGIPRDDQRRGLDAGDLLGEVEILLHRVTDLAQEPWPILRPRRDAGIQLVHRRLLHLLGHRRAHLALLSEDVGIECIAPERRRNHHEFPDHLRVSDGQLQR